jgi:hypothetical protein
VTATHGANITDSDEPKRLLLPIPGLELTQQWDVGHVKFHPAGAAAKLIEASRNANFQDAPDWFRSRVSSTAGELDSCAVADISVRGDIDDAIPIVESAVTVLRAVQQRRALIAVQLLSNSWLSGQPDVRLLNAVMALEVLLGGDTGTKKHLIARRVSYFTCGWPGPVYADGTRTACALMSLPLRPNGSPGPGLAELLDEMRAGNIRPCSQYLDALALYDARSTIVHEGKLGLSADQEDSATWFIAVRLLHRVLAWFAVHPNNGPTELDRQITALSSAQT